MPSKDRAKQAESAEKLRNRRLNRDHFQMRDKEDPAFAQRLASGFGEGQVSNDNDDDNDDEEGDE